MGMNSSEVWYSVMRKSDDSCVMDFSARFGSIEIRAEMLLSVLKRKCGLSWFLRKSSSYCTRERFCSRMMNALMIWRNMMWYTTQITHTKLTRRINVMSVQAEKCPLA